MERAVMGRAVMKSAVVECWMEIRSYRLRPGVWRTARAATQWITRPTSDVIPVDDPTIDRLRNKEIDDV